MGRVNELKFKKSETGAEDGAYALNRLFTLSSSGDGRVDVGVLAISSVLPMA